MNQQEREDNLNSMMNGEAGLVVEKINGLDNGMAQSSNHSNQPHQRDMAREISDKKSVHVRTDWAAKYLK